MDWVICSWVRPFYRVTVNGYTRCSSGGALGDAAAMTAVPAAGPTGAVMYTCMGRMRGTSSGSESSPEADSKVAWVPPTKYAGLDGGVDEAQGTTTSSVVRAKLVVGDEHRGVAVENDVERISREFIVGGHGGSRCSR